MAVSRPALRLEPGERTSGSSSVAGLVATIARLCKLIGAGEQRKLLHSIIVDGLDGTAEVAFAKANPRRGAGAIEINRRRIGRSLRARGFGEEIDAKTAAARAAHVPAHFDHEVFPNRARITDIDIHDATRHGIVRDPGTGFSNNEAAIRTRETPTSAADHGLRKIYSQIVDPGLRVTHGEECAKRAVTATHVVQGEWRREVANLQQLHEAQALGGLAGPIHP